MKGLRLLIITCALLIPSYINAQTPSVLRVNVDANGSLVAMGYAQTAPLTTCLFSNCRLAVDASGNLKVVIVGGTVTSPIFAPTQSNCSTVSYSFTGRTTTGLNSHAANTWNLCGGGTLGLSGNTTLITASLPIAIGTNPASIGILRFPNSDSLYARNAANTADVHLLSLNPSNNVVLSGSASINVLIGSGDFRTMLGGTTSSFPAIKRNGAGIDFRLADDSAYAFITAGTIDAASGNLSSTGGNILVRNVGQIGTIGRGTFQFPADGKVTWSNAGGTSPITFQTTGVPTCTAANNCGTGDGVFATGSNDTAGSVTLGTTPASGFIITFNGTWSAAPTCNVWMAKAGMVVGKLPLTIVTSTTTITVVTNGTAPDTGDIYSYHCIGIQ